ncbi:MAG: helix-turn-helix transcriptional regulator [Oscillospiraceae bacterium]|nr:helix-turn-helix transcriptional regulator [Oscillospiraceae bacterium]
MGSTMAEIAERIRQRRTALGYSYQDLADLTGMNKSSLQRYETGGIGNVPLHRITTLAHALEVSPEWLMGWDEAEVVVSKTDPQIDRILAAAKHLSAQGLEKLGTYAEDLAGNPAYRKDK